MRSPACAFPLGREPGPLVLAPPAAASSTGYGYPDPSNPAAVQIGRGYNQQFYLCPAAPSIRTPS
ncbi:hypothetical protein [Nonomuraea fuscirosea]|uniref:hypothetical protein n=1 Tax=Nonomuraea fuscirosea TaxID=1291556 RepID=UPI0011B295FB|nr:hypothetical protein [Nonomuraea fuscirosea]